MMNTALQRWNSKDERSLNEILGIFDENGMPVPDVQHNPHLNMRVIGMELDFPDDLSTIADDLEPSEPRTPDRPPRKSKNIDLNDDDDDTVPESPPKDSPGSMVYKVLTADAFERQWSSRFRRLLILASFVGIIILGAIAVLSMTLYQIRNETEQQGPDPPTSDVDGEDSTASPHDFWDDESNMTGSYDMLWIDWTIRSTAADFYLDADTLPADNTTIQYQVLEWMAGDPMISRYTPNRLVQRFALGVVYWSLTAPSTDSVMGGWMTYTDECQWPLSRNTRDMCDSRGSVTALYLEDMGFYGTLASEIGLLKHLEHIFLTSNSIRGEMPTDIGHLTALERLNVPRNEISGTIPTEIGLLENLGKGLMTLFRPRFAKSTVTHFFTFTPFVLSGMLVLGNNMLEGPLPSEIGNMERLGSLLVHSNRLNGTLPDELLELPRLTRLQLDSNNFEGPIPGGLGNLTLLEELTLQGNNLTGEIPMELCTESEALVVAVDCDKVQCTCCAECTNGTFVEQVPNKEDGAAPVSDTLTPTSCQDVQAVRSCYTVTDPIDLITTNCDPSEMDVLALFQTIDLEDDGFRNAVFWIPACNTTRCDSVIDNGTFFRDDGSSEPLDTWPLAAAEYKLLMLRIFEPGSLAILAESPAFQVSEQCDDVSRQSPPH